MAVQSAASDPRYLMFIDNRLTVLHNRHHAANECDVVALPFPRTARLFLGWRQKAIHSARAHRWPFRIGVIFDLNFVPPAQVDAAIRSFRADEFNMQLEIVEFCSTDQLRSMAGTHQSSVFHRPLGGRVRVAHRPSGQILAIKQRHRFPPLGLPVSREFWRSFSGPSPWSSIRTR